MQRQSREEIKQEFLQRLESADRNGDLTALGWNIEDLATLYADAVHSSETLNSAVPLAAAAKPAGRSPGTERKQNTHINGFQYRLS